MRETDTPVMLPTAALAKIAIPAGLACSLAYLATVFLLPEEFRYAFALALILTAAPLCQSIMMERSRFLSPSPKADHLAAKAHSASIFMTVVVLAGLSYFTAGYFHAAGGSRSACFKEKLADLKEAVAETRRAYFAVMAC
jgi:hypothetical protein